jgi:hypothetical protein
LDEILLIALRIRGNPGTCSFVQDIFTLEDIASCLIKGPQTMAKTILKTAHRFQGSIGSPEAPFMYFLAVQIVSSASDSDAIGMEVGPSAVGKT